MKKLSEIFDFVFGTTFVFLSVLIWMRYFVHNTWLTLTISGAIAFSLVGLIHFVKQKKKDKTNITKQELTNANNCTKHFMFSNKTDALNVLLNLLKTKYEVIKKSDYLIFNNIVLRPIYYKLKITDEMVLETFVKTKSLNPKKIIIVSKSIEANALQFAKSIKQTEIVLLNEQEFYFSILKPLNFQCQNAEFEAIKKEHHFKNFLNVVFNKQRTKGYTITAVILLFASFLLRYNLYYIIMTSVLSFFAIFSHFNKAFNPLTKNDVLN